MEFKEKYHNTFKHIIHTNEEDKDFMINKSIERYGRVYSNIDKSYTKEKLLMFIRDGDIAILNHPLDLLNWCGSYLEYIDLLEEISDRTEKFIWMSDKDVDYKTPTGKLIIQMIPSILKLSEEYLKNNKYIVEKISKFNI